MVLVIRYHTDQKTEGELVLNRKLYFGYGANSNIDAMTRRCPKARRIGKAILRHHRLVFRSIADIQVSHNDIVHGAMWMITLRCEASLDLYEGFPHLYEKKFVNVSHQDHGDVEAMLYIMSKPSSLEPTAKQYVDLIAQGYSDFGIPMHQLSDAVEEAEQAYNEEIEQIRRLELNYSIDN